MLVERAKTTAPRIITGKSANSGRNLRMFLRDMILVGSERRSSSGLRPVSLFFSCEKADMDLVKHEFWCQCNR